MPEDDPPLTRAQIEAMFRFADDLLEQARARARARGLTPAEIEAEEIDDDSEFWDDVRTIGPTGLASTLGERFAMDSRGPRLSHQTKPLQVCPCADEWRCAQHVDQPWPHDYCTGPRMPCPRCQPEAPSDAPESL